MKFAVGLLSQKMSVACLFELKMRTGSGHFLFPNLATKRKFQLFTMDLGAHHYLLFSSVLNMLQYASARFIQIL